MNQCDKKVSYFLSQESKFAVSQQNITSEQVSREKAARYKKVNERN